MDYRNTSHQTARGARPDATAGNRLYLFKRTTRLHATYQIRLLAFLAQKSRQTLIIRVPLGFEPEPSLRKLLAEAGKVVRIEKVAP